MIASDVQESQEVAGMLGEHLVIGDLNLAQQFLALMRRRTRVDPQAEHLIAKPNVKGALRGQTR